MGTSKTTAELSGKLAKMATATARIPTKTERPNADTAERVMGGAVRRMAPRGRLSGAGASVGATGVPRGNGRVEVVPAGPVWLVENNTARHAIGAEGEVLRIGGAFVTGPVPHPGTVGKGEWARARDGSELPRAVVTTTGNEMATTLGEVFG